MSSIIKQQSSGLATETQDGLVSTGTQTFGGDKTFSGNVTLNGLTNQHLFHHYWGFASDPGSYPEYKLLARQNSGDAFQLIGDIYGFRGNAGERNCRIAITCTKTNFPSVAYYGRAMPGSASTLTSLVTLTYNGNSWLALRLDGSAGNWGGVRFYYTGVSNHSSGVSDSTMLFPGQSITSGVSNVVLVLDIVS